MEEIKLELFPTGESGSQAAVKEEPADVVLSTNEEKALSFKNLTEQEQKMVRDFVDKIDISDSNQVVTYGSASQNKIAQFSDNVLKNVRTKDSGEAGKLLSNLVVEIKNFDTAGDEKGGLLKMFGGVKKSVDKMMAGYAKVEANIDTITDMLEGHRKQLLKDITMYDGLYESNYAYFKELNLYIIAGKEKLREVNEVMIPELERKARETEDESDAQRLNDLVNATNRFEKKIHDLQLSRMISIQMGPQIRLIQNNDAQLVDKIQSSIVNSIPLWKNQIVIALGLANSKAALETQKRVTDMTNDLLRKNSEMLKQGSLEIAKESERGIVSIDTIRKTNQDLIDTINGVLQIQKQGHQERTAAEQELVKIESELKQALINAKNYSA